jgi:hypothetical protein
MELTRECLEEIALAALEAENGKLVITVQPRPEDKRSFDLKCEYEKRFRVYREESGAIPTKTAGRNTPEDKLPIDKP